MNIQNYSEILCGNISRLRKDKGLTQEALAGMLGLSFQAVSKWENQISCPDIALLPKLAEIFEVSLDQLFHAPSDGQPAAESQEKAEDECNIHIENAEEPSQETPSEGHDREYRQELRFWGSPSGPVSGLPWDDDGAIRCAVFRGRTLVTGPCQEAEKIYFEYEGEAAQVISYLSVSCGDVEGDITAGANVQCEDVNGDIHSGSSTTCGDVAGNVSAGSSVQCHDVGGNVKAGGGVECDDVDGNVSAGGWVKCGDVDGSVSCGANVTCQDVGGNVTSSGGNINCGDVDGSVTGGRVRHG